MDYILKSIKISDKKGNRIKMTLFAEDGSKKEVNVSESTYRRIGSPLSGYIIDGDTISSISEEDEKYRCLIKAMSLLSYGDNSELRLKTKLKAKGFSPSSIDYALREAIGLSYLNEERQIGIRIINLSHRSLYGPIRIVAKLSSEGYPVSKIRSALASLTENGEISFEETKKVLLEKHAPETAEDKRKLLVKYGYVKL